MQVRRGILIGCAGLLCLFGTSCRLVRYVGPQSPTGLMARSAGNLHDVVQPPPGTPARTLQARFRIVEAEGLAKELAGREIELAFQAPDRLFVDLPVGDREFQLGRHGQQLWIYSVDKKFCLLGRPEVRPFDWLPEREVSPTLSPVESPWPRGKLVLAPRELDVERRADEYVGTNRCITLSAVGRPDWVKAKRLPAGQLELWLRPSDLLPLRLRYSEPAGVRVTVEAEELALQAPWPDGRWDFHQSSEDRVQTVAPSQLTKFLAARWATLTQKIPTLGPPSGEHRVMASEGGGRLEDIEGTKVLFVSGTPEQMGHQHGSLLRKNVRHDVRQVLYGIGVGSSLASGKWFFGEMEQAEQRLLPHMDARYLREMDALAAAAGVPKQELRMANLFPELFHCSGFALYGDATAGGRLYQGRILDYFRGQGLEQNAVVIVFRPNDANAWVDISYAGFVGSVTAMNEKKIAIGEMGGRGEGQWDGTPMAQLVRQVMERANTIDQALEILRDAHRTCEYYYVISDGNTRRAVAVHATPTEFETAWAGQTHPLVRYPIKDAVAVSGGDRYEELISRIKAGYGTFDAASARELMKPPVCMRSNIHSVLFAPETLDFWVANADRHHVASETRWTHYNLAELLGPEHGALAAK